jgi:hypothetical protein
MPSFSSVYTIFDKGRARKKKKKKGLGFRRAQRKV